MGRIRCSLYHSLRLSRDARWGDAYRVGRPEARQRTATTHEPALLPRRPAPVIALLDRSRRDGVGA